MLVAGLVAVRWYWRRAALDGAIERGLELLALADSPTETVATLDEWERQTARRWQHRPDDLVHHLYSNYPLKDRRVRTLLARVAGVDYGDRPEDWQRWFKTRRRLRQGQQPQVPAKQRVRLKPKWHAPVGLTGWFSTIIPLDGYIYVASLGASFDDESDTADGVVRVDATSGAAALIFEPPDGRVRDVLGIAAGNDCLFVAARNGRLYCIDPDGALRWTGLVGEPLGGAPLSIDINRDGVTDAIAVAASGKVVAFSGRTGQTVWVTPAPGRRPRSSSREIGALLAATDLAGTGDRSVIVTVPNGAARLLALRTGQVRWEDRTMAGSLAGPLACGSRAGIGPPAFVADRDALVWALAGTPGRCSTALAWDLLSRRGESVIAGLRTLARDAGPPLIIACPTGSASGYRASVCALQPGGVRWRYAPGGAIWATPALADINGDGETETIVASITGDQAGTATGVLTILSHDGHCLRRLTLPAPIECAPVVADLDGDNRLELLVADQAGWLHCFTTGKIGPVEWGLLGGDSHNTRNAEYAYRYAQVPTGMQWHWTPD